MGGREWERGRKGGREKEMGEKKDNKFMSMFPVRTNQTLALSVHSFESQHHTNTIVRGLGENAPKTLAGCSFPNKTNAIITRFEQQRLYLLPPSFLSSSLAPHPK